MLQRPRRVHSVEEERCVNTGATYVVTPEGRIDGESFKVRFCKVPTEPYPGYLPGNTLHNTSVSPVRHLYPYPELLQALYDLHTRTRNFCKFCTPCFTIPELPVQRFYT